MNKQRFSFHTAKPPGGTIYFAAKRPVSFHGSVMYSDFSNPFVPIGKIEVIIDGQVRAYKNFTNSSYGSTAADYLQVEQIYFENAGNIRFEVNGMEAVPVQVIDWSSAGGKVLQLDLVTKKYYTYEGYFTYDISGGGGARITDYSKDGPRDLVIPRKLGGAPVTYIAGHWVLTS